MWCILVQLEKDSNMLKHYTLLSVFFYLLLHSDSVEGITSYSYVKISFISSGVNNSLIHRSYTASSEIECTMYCLRHCNTYSFYFARIAVENCHCNSEDDQNVVFLDLKTDIKYGYSEKDIIISNTTSTTYSRNQSYPNDCLDLYEKGCREDGIYYIKPAGARGDREVTWCDMRNGGWTVIQKRSDGSEDFYRPWDEYVKGFGNRTREYWIGLENIYQLTKGNSRLRVELDTFGDVAPTNLWAEYAFSLGSAAANYVLNVSGFSGSCGDALSYSNGRGFTTRDKDNDGHAASNCAVVYHGAWWYYTCHYSNLNGFYHGGKTTSFGTGMNWYQCWGHYYSVKTSVMKVKRIQL